MTQRIEMIPHIPSVVTDMALIRKLWAITRSTEDEVSGLGEISAGKDEIRLVEPFHLLNQEGSMGSTELDMDAVANLLTDYVQTGKDPSAIGFWYHTHNRMPAFFSQTDKDTISKLSGMMPTLIAGVFNFNGDTEWCIVHHGFKFNWEYRIPGALPSKDEMALWEDKVKAVVRKRKWESTGLWKGYRSEYSGYGGYNEMGDDDWGLGYPRVGFHGSQEVGRKDPDAFEVDYKGTTHRGKHKKGKR